MIVLQINSVYKKGSTGKIAHSIHEELMEVGNKSYVSYGRGNNKSCSPFVIRIGGDFDLYMHGLMTRLFDLHGFGSKRATVQFIKKIEEISPNIVHLHNAHGYYLNIYLLFDYFKISKTQVIWTFHDCWPFTGHCTYFEYVGCDKWQTQCYKCPQRSRYPKSWLLDNSAFNYKAKKDAFTGVENLTIVVPSNWMASLVKKSFLKRYPIEIINNGIDLETFRPRVNNFRKKYGIEKKFVILGVAYIWEKRKGIRYFYELEKRLEKDEIIVIVGQQRGHRRKNSNKVIYIERTDNKEQLAEIYTSADVFVNPALEDNFPTTNLEALACGTPVITFNSGGSSESINDKCGVVIEKGNLKMLEEAIRHIKRAGKEKYSDICINRAREYYSDKAMALKYVHLYERILKETLN